MKKDAIYESNISTVKWLIYDVPGNVGWILYIYQLVRLFMNPPGFMEMPLMQISAEASGDIFSFPADVLTFLNFGTGTGQILHGSIGL